MEKALIEIAALGSLAAEDRFGAAGFGVFHLLLDLLSLGLQVNGAHAGFFAHAVADRFLLQNLHQTADKFLGDGFMEEQAFHAETHLAAVEEAADVGHLHGHIQIGVFHDDHWITAAKLQSDSFDFSAGDFHDVTPNRSGAGEGDAANAWIAQDLFADCAARAGDDVDRALGHLLLSFAFTKRRLLDQFDGANGCEGSSASRFDDDRVASGQRWAEFGTHEGQREIPRHDATAHTD